MHIHHAKFRSTFALSSALALALVMQLAMAAGPTKIHNEPMAQALSSVEPNIMFILDDSGSMDWEYTPDYVTTNSQVTARNCRPQANSGGTLQSTLVDCDFGDLPYNAYEFNTQYYNPNVYYRPSPAAGGEDVATRNLNSANTSAWTSVKNDAYGKNTGGLPGVSGTTINLTNQVPRRVWCNSQTPNVNSADCQENSDHSYPDSTYKYRNIRSGAPYYFRVAQPQYCTDQGKTTCQTDADTSYTVRTPVRFCTNSSLSNCQSKRSGTYTYPYFAGTLNPSTLVLEKLAKATITVQDSKTNTSISVSQIYAGTTPLMGSAVTASGGTNSSSERTTAATQIRNAINALTGTHGYTATSNNEIVTITAPVGSGSNANGVTLQPTTIAGGNAAAITLTITAVPNVSNSNDRQLNSLTIDGVSIIGSTYRITLPRNDPTGAATEIANRINSYNNNTPWEYTATASGNSVTIRAPQDMGAIPNGLAVAYTKDNNVNINPSSGSSLSGGTGGTNLPLATSSFSGGVTASGTTAHWESTIQFERVDIVPTAGGVAKTFPRNVERQDRVDCANASFCTYDEEMTNYANWYSYYRSRMQAAKTSAGRAFSGLGKTMRVGFITINPGGTVSSNKYLKIDNFNYDKTTNSGHKLDWYEKLYDANANGGTPLREALSRVGRLYAGKFDGINNGIPAADDPVQYACQPNFSILTTDGYWNGNSGRDIDGTSNIGNEDNTDSGYSKRIDGAYDGGLSGASGTLADVAMYYYKTDLRPGMADSVFTTSKDTAQHQHMTTFTVGLGLSGLLDFTTDYESQGPSKPGDFWAIRQGTKNWPAPTQNTESALDDLWHAAVNGRGTFYSAANPQDFQNGLTDALNQMFARSGAGAAAATSNLQPTAGDNFAFTAEYETQTWIGDISARTISPITGNVSNRPLWSAGALLNQRNYMDRVIYTYDAADTVGNITVPGSGNKLRHFCWPGSTAASCTEGNGLTTTEQDYFLPSQLGQWSGWPINKQSAASASNLFAFIRGDRSLETSGGNSDEDLYRSRKSVLGDIVNSQPAYMKESPFKYNDPHYLAFKISSAARKGTVYAAANDGMLHAFETDVNNDPYYQTTGVGTDTFTDDAFVGNNAGNGEERWAYVPSALISKMYSLAETPYAHRYFADGSPVIGDVCDGHTAGTPCADVTQWRTILVAGLNAGGRSYYALDISNPDQPKALWEFTASASCLSDVQANSGTYASDCNLGLSFGNPLIVKRPLDDRWVVIVSSGYNNISPGDGKGYLYILDAISGKILERHTTGEGSAGILADLSDANPSGLGRINAWASNAIENNQALTVYGGDLLGNLWRFDLVTGSVSKLAVLQDQSGKAQPITVKPELGDLAPYRIVLLGTGRYLGSNDVSDQSKQSIYAIRDDNLGGTITGRTGMLPRTLTPTSATERTGSGALAMDWNNFNGWYIDLPDAGERVNVDPQLQLGTLIIASNVPSTDTCQAGGYGWLNYLDYKKGTGQSSKVGNAMIVGLSTIKLAGGTVHTIVTTADNKRTTVTPPVSTTAIAGRRVSWREVISE